jgi:DNA-binding CsgD family transcriptional regulator
VQRAERAVSAAQSKVRAGAFDAAVELLAMAEAGPINDLTQARIDLVRAELAYVTNWGNDAPALLLTAARRLEPIDTDISRATYLDALSAAMFAGRFANPGAGVLDVAGAAAVAPPPPSPPGARDLLLDGLAASYNQGYAAGLPMLRQALAIFGDGMSAEEQLRWIWLATVAAMRVWDDGRWDALSSRHVQLARETGALSELPLALVSRTCALVFAGELTVAASLTEETQAVKEAIGSNLAPYGALGVAAYRGDIKTAETLIDATLDDVQQRREGAGITFAEWANAVLNNGLGRYDKALGAAQRATAYEPDLGSLIWPIVELIEAAARTGTTETAASAYRQLSDMTSMSRTDWALGLEARSGALLSDGQVAEHLYRDSIVRLGRTRQRLDLARAHLLYGEWLRRQRRPIDAREQLRAAHHMLDAMGVEAFAERAGRELRATGDAPRRRTVAAKHTELTRQEAQIARLARDGLSNPEIGTRLFISAHTVQYHLRKVFAKLGVTSRSQLYRVLPKEPPALAGRDTVP